MDPDCLDAWSSCLAGAVVLGIFFSLSTRQSYLRTEEVESTPDVTLARLKQDPTQMPPLSIVSRLGAEATLELLEYGDQVPTNEWRYRWGAVREQLLYLLSRAECLWADLCIGPLLSQCRISQEPDTLRIRRTALIHKLGVLCYLDPDANDNPAQLRVRYHPAEVQGDLGFDGETLWLLPEEPAPTPVGPLVEMAPVEFRTLAGRGDPGPYSPFAHGRRRLSDASDQAAQDVGGCG